MPHAASLTEPPSVALVGGPLLLRESLGALLAHQPACDLIGTWRSASVLLAASLDARPAAVVVDLEHRPLSDVEALRTAWPECTLAALCIEVTDHLRGMTALGGVHCVVLKQASAAELAVAVNHALNGHLVLPPRWVRKNARGELAGLTRRPRQVLELVSEGLSTEEIARRLDISPHTVKFHLRELYWRLGVRNRVEARRVHNGLPRASV